MKCWALGLFSLVLLEGVTAQSPDAEESSDTSIMISPKKNDTSSGNTSSGNTTSGNTTAPSGGGHGGGHAGGHTGGHGGGSGGVTVKPAAASSKSNMSLSACLSLLFSSIALHTLWLLAPFDDSHFQ